MARAGIYAESISADISPERLWRYFSPQASGFLNLIDSDIQRPISNIRTNLDIGDLFGRASQVIETLKSVSIDVQDHKAHIFSMRISP